MLYMIESHHGPETCAFTSADAKRYAEKTAAEVKDRAAARGCEFKGSWISMAAHRGYMLMDGPDAHTVEDVVTDINLMSWNTVTIYPVRPLTDALAIIDEHEG